jgi:hypothetical protein
MSAHLITLKCGLSDPGARPDTGRQLRDVLTGLMPQIWAGARTDVRLIFQNPTTGAALVTTEWALVTFRLMAADRTTLYVSKTVEPEDFVGTSPKEATIELTTANTTLPEGEYWLSTFATLSAGGFLPLGLGPLKVVNGGMLTTVDPAAIEEPVYTQAQVDALVRGRAIVRIVNDYLIIFALGQNWKIQMIPIATPAGVSVDGLTVMNGVMVFTENGSSWKSQQLTPHNE